MKLNRLASTNQSLPHDAAERVRHVDTPLLRVDAQEGVEADRQRSLQQELNEFEQSAIAPFHGSEHILADTRELASQLSLLGNQVDALMKPQSALLKKIRAVDESA